MCKRLARPRSRWLLFFILTHLGLVTCAGQEQDLNRIRVRQACIRSCVDGEDVAIACDREDIGGCRGCTSRSKRARPLFTKFRNGNHHPELTVHVILRNQLSLVSSTRFSRLPRLSAKSCVRTPNFSRSLTTIPSQVQLQALVADNQHRNHGYRIDRPV